MNLADKLGQLKESRAAVISPREKLQALLKSHKDWIQTNGEIGEELYARGLELRYLDFRGSIIEDCSFEDTIIKNSNCKNAIIKDSNLSLVAVHGCDLYRANITSKGE